MSLYGVKTAVAAVQPWSKTIDLAGAGLGPAGLFSLYDSAGDVTIVGSQTFASLLDGPEVVKRFGALTIGDGSTTSSFTASQRCKGGVILCDTLLVKNAATLHMTGKGARVLTNDDPFFPFSDFKIPFQINLSSDRVSLAKALAIIKAQGLAPWDAGTFAATVSGMFGFNVSVALDGNTALFLASALGAGATYRYTTGSSVGGNAGGSGCFGGGGTGAIIDGGGGGTVYTRSGRPSSPYGGGSGVGAVSTTGNAGPAQGLAHGEQDIFSYSGRGGSGIQADSSYSCGGGAGNPGGAGASGGSSGSNGVGGKLVIIARTSVTVQSGGKIEANGTPGGSAGGAGGGGSGGGNISIITPSYSNSGTVQCAGGAGGAGGTVNGGAGGAGSVVTKTFTDMGW